MKTKLLLAAAAVGALAVSGCMTPTIGAMPGEGLTQVADTSYAAAIADPLRPADEVARDPLRHPAEMLAFAHVKEGDRIADIR
ncbi:MAG: hypothetical protein JWR59_110, partial [Brevundimonas sp.]|nr:hypothetical protein [Brevundimonas sp.]